MKILMYGDSITDAGRSREGDFELSSYGHGYPKFIAGELLGENPVGYEIYNRGISGNRIVDLYARIKADVWNLQPDVLSILIGINDIWHGIDWGNGVGLERFERIYRMLLDDTLERLPNLKVILCEPFVLRGISTAATEERFEKFSKVKEYAAVVKKIAKDYNFPFVALQEKFDEAAKKFPAETLLSDGVHPAVAGAKLIADEWVKVYKSEIEK